MRREAFSEPFYNIEEHKKREVINKIKQTIKGVFLSNEEDKIIESFYEDFNMECITLLEHTGDNIEHILTLSVPFEGDPSLLSYRPSTFRFSSSFKSPFIERNEIKYEFNLLGNNESQVQRYLDSVLSMIKENVSNLNSDIKKFNVQLKELIENSVKNRIEEIKKTSDIISKLNIKLKKREDSPRTYVVPLKKKIELASKIETEKSSGLDPKLSDQTYEEILSIIDNMAQVMERSPSAFSNMEEEDLRIHFLVQLNGQYEGEALGEVFNLEGRTDILIRHNGANVFIAECKFWDGKEKLIDTVDQLLNYISWRDTKTSIILFNKNKDTSKVLAQIPNIIKESPSFIKQEEYNKENSFRFTMKNKNDERKHFLLTIKLFDVPK